MELQSRALPLRCLPPEGHSHTPGQTPHPVQTAHLSSDELQSFPSVPGQRHASSLRQTSCYWLIPAKQPIVHWKHCWQNPTSHGKAILRNTESINREQIGEKQQWQMDKGHTKSGPRTVNKSWAAGHWGECKQVSTSCTKFSNNGRKSFSSLQWHLLEKLKTNTNTQKWVDFKCKRPVKMNQESRAKSCSLKLSPPPKKKRNGERTSSKMQKGKSAHFVLMIRKPLSQ